MQPGTKVQGLSIFEKYTEIPKTIQAISKGNGTIFYSSYMLPKVVSFLQIPCKLIGWSDGHCIKHEDLFLLFFNKFLLFLLFLLCIGRNQKCRCHIFIRIGISHNIAYNFLLFLLSHFHIVGLGFRFLKCIVSLIDMCLEYIWYIGLR